VKYETRTCNISLTRTEQRSANLKGNVLGPTQRNLTQTGNHAMTTGNAQIYRKLQTNRLICTMHFSHVPHSNIPPKIYVTGFKNGFYHGRKQYFQAEVFWVVRPCTVMVGSSA